MKDALSDLGEDTLLTHLGLDPAGNHGIVNPPVYHASTILFPSVEAMEKAGRSFDNFRYGRIGTPTSKSFEQAIADLEGGYKAVSAPSGLAAISMVMMALVKAGDHVLVTDSVYGPTRALCVDVLARLGVETEFYDPLIGADIAHLIRPNTSVVYVEAPGSLTFEMQDIPAIVKAAKTGRAKVVMDNTWATPLFFKPLEHGVDVSVHAATKYIVGHSDAMLGIAICTEEAYALVKKTAVLTGVCAGPDDMFLGLRGLRTMAVRLQRHQESAIAVARWFQGRPEVSHVLHPALPEDPGHAIWKRDFRGACGLFGVALHPVPKAAVSAMLDHLELFGIGYSWGGYESLAIPSHPEQMRTARPWTEKTSLIRLHIGLEDVDDLIRDLERGLQRLRNAA